MKLDTYCHIYTVQVIQEYTAAAAVHQKMISHRFLRARCRRPCGPWTPRGPCAAPKWARQWRPRCISRWPRNCCCRRRSSLPCRRSCSVERPWFVNQGGDETEIRWHCDIEVVRCRLNQLGLSDMHSAFSCFWIVFVCCRSWFGDFDEA